LLIRRRRARNLLQRFDIEIRMMVSRDGNRLRPAIRYVKFAGLKWAAVLRCEHVGNWAQGLCATMKSE